MMMPHVNLQFGIVNYAWLMRFDKKIGYIYDATSNDFI
jgi:hypothetical protein